MQVLAGNVSSTERSCISYYDPSCISYYDPSQVSVTTSNDVYLIPVSVAATYADPQTFAAALPSDRALYSGYDDPNATIKAAGAYV